MHLAEMLALRSVPCAGVFVSITRRCPLACQHCSTNSTPKSEELEAKFFLDFVRTFSAENRPDFVLLTGGEALLRPALVSSIAAIAHSVGSKVSLISGMFFAVAQSVPGPIAQAIADVDHFTASLDAFHEREVSREAVLTILAKLAESGKDVSLQIIGTGPDDPYLADVIADVRKTLHDKVPALVAEVHAVGRAADWMPKRVPTEISSDIDPSPCSMAAWPVVAFDGSVTLCCNQDVVDGIRSKHLKVGNVADDTWETIRARHTSGGMQRAIRVFGPQYLASRFGNMHHECQGYCETCQHLSDDSELTTHVEDLGSRPTMALVEAEVAKTLGQMPLQGTMMKYSYLAYLGASATGKGLLHANDLGGREL